MKSKPSIPASVSRGLRWLLGDPFRLQAAVRRRLPTWCGGKFKDQDVYACTLDATQCADLGSLLSSSLGCGSRAALVQAPARGKAFSAGLYLGTRLVAASHCSRQWFSLGIEEYFLGGTLVAPRLRRRGLGQLLTGFQLRTAALRGIPQVFVNMAETNRASLGCYLAAGFYPVHRPRWTERIRAHWRAHTPEPASHIILGRPTPASPGPSTDSSW